MIPLYGFLAGDTVGLLVLAEEADTMQTLASKLQQAARVRVAPTPWVKVIHRGRELDMTSTVAHAGIEALDRFDVVRR